MKYSNYSFGILVIALTFGLFLVSQPSFALLENSIGSLRQDRQSEQAQIRFIQIRGNLICEADQATSQTQSDCALKIQETASGKVFALTDAAAAMTLFKAGNRNILIEGTLANNNTIQVKRAQNL